MDVRSRWSPDSSVIRSLRSGRPPIASLSQFTQVDCWFLAKDPPGADHAEPNGDRKASARGGEGGGPVEDEMELHDVVDDPIGGERPRADAECGGRSPQNRIFYEEHRRQPSAGRAKDFQDCRVGESSA